MSVAYSRAFFDFQLGFATRLVARFGMPLDDALAHYTTFTKTLGTGAWAEYFAGVQQAADAADWTYQYYCAHRHPDPAPHDTHFFGNPLFGCFFFSVRDEHIIRPHFINNALPGTRPLSQTQVTQRHAELTRMFAHIQQFVPQADTVLGNSWLYNLAAYRRLYPPAYTQELPVSTEDEFQFLALWGQCFDSAWQVREDVGRELMRRVDQLRHLDGLRECFPYQVLQPRCSIQEWYDFYLKH